MGIVFQSRQIALCDPCIGGDNGQAQPQRFAGRFEGCNRLLQHGMADPRPLPTGHQFRFFLFDLFTDRR
jgi:hypothetical protein